jgi:hypothetical protein
VNYGVKIKISPCPTKVMASATPLICPNRNPCTQETQ